MRSKLNREWVSRFPPWAVWLTDLSLSLIDFVPIMGIAAWSSVRQRYAISKATNSSARAGIHVDRIGRGAYHFEHPHWSFSPRIGESKSKKPDNHLPE